MIMTPVAGSIIGETTYQLGRYLARSGTGRAALRRARSCSRPWRAINDRPICRAGRACCRGRSSGSSVGVGRAIFNGSLVKEQLALAVGSEIVTQRAYQRPGSGMRGGDAGPVDGALPRHALRRQPAGGAVVPRRDRVGRPLRSQLPASAATRRDVPVSGARPRGWGTMLGLGSSSTTGCAICRRMHDRIASLGLGGPMFELSARGSVLVRLSLSAQYAFAIIGSMAYRDDYPAGVRPDDQDVAALQRLLLRARRDVGGHADTSISGRSASPATRAGAGTGRSTRAIPSQSAIDRDVLLRDSRIYLTGAMWSRPGQRAPVRPDRRARPARQLHARLQRHRHRGRHPRRPSLSAFSARSARLFGVGGRGGRSFGRST